MIGGFDKFSNYEVPIITLCNPSAKATIYNNNSVKLSNAIGILTDPKGVRLQLNFNAPYEVSFDYERHISEDPIKQSFYDKIYNDIMTDRYLFLETVGFYIITAVNDSDEDGIDKKSITAQSCEREHENFEGINIKEDTAYPLHTTEGTGLLDLYIANCPNWTIKYIDPVLLYKNGIDGEVRVYTFDKIDAEDGYKFLWETIQNGCECIVEPDILTRELSFYSRELYAQNHKTDILVARYNLLKHRTVEDDDEDKWTALNVLGKDEDLRISMVNPTGMNTLYNFTYRYPWMSTELQEALNKWQEKINSIEDEYYELVSNYAPQRDILWNKAEDIQVLEAELEQLQKTRDITITQSGDEQQSVLDNVNAQISEKENEIATTKAEYETFSETIKTTYEYPINQINSDCQLAITAKDINGNIIFTEELLKELASHVKTTDYNDEYLSITENMTWVKKYEIAKQLYDRAKSQMIKLSSGKKTVKIDTASFLFNERFKHFSDQLVVGAIINAEITKGNIEEWHLTGIDIDFNERKTDFTLGNKYDRSDLKQLFEDTLGSHSKASSDLKYLKSIIEEQQRIIDNTTSWLELSRTLTLNNILKSENQSVIINDRGYWGREWLYNQNDDPNLPIYSPEQIKIINNGLYITNDNWRSLSVALGKVKVGEGENDYQYGLNADVLMGKLLLGNNLILSGKAAGISILNDNDEKVFCADDEGNLYIKGHIDATSGYIGNLNLINSKLFCLADDTNSWVSGLNGNYHTASDNTIFLWAGARGGDGIAIEDTKNTFGSNTWTDAKEIIESTANFYVTQTGELYAKQGNIGGWSLSTGILQAKDTSNRYCGIGLSGYAYAFYAGSTQSGGEDGVFRVGHDGYLQATNANIDGTITAKSGKIGGWEIANNGLSIDINSNKILMVAPTKIASSGAGSDVFIVRTSDNVDTFRLNSDGSLLATKATITGAITATSGNFSNCTIDNTCTIKGRLSGVTGDFSGSISASSGNIGNWSILSSGAYSGCLYGTDGTTTGYYGVYLSPKALYVNDASYVFDVRWYYVYKAAVNYQNNTSDKNSKNSITSYDERYDMFFDNLSPCKYKYNSGTSNRFHTGFIAQQVVEALENSELTTSDFAAVVHLETPDPTGAEWLLRRDEFVSLNTWQIQKLKNRVTELENIVNQLTHKDNS